MMNKEEILVAWAPELSPWAPWTKTVLFANLDAALDEVSPAAVVGDVSWAPSAGEKTALVLDLPGAEGVLTGMALMARGYRPVPLYNALPLPFGRPVLDLQSGRRVAAVNVLPIVAALRDGAEMIASSQLPAEAPPAFLLDSNRQGDGRKIQPKEFDNRSVCFTTDFPSANFLLAQGVRRVLLVQKDIFELRPDLAHVFRRWQDGGLALERIRSAYPGKPQPFEVNRPTWYGLMFQRALSAFGLRRAATGGFGAWMPDSSSGG